MARGIKLIDSPFNGGDELERVIASFAQVPNGGLIIPPGSWNLDLGEKIVALAAQYRISAIYAQQSLVASGGLIGYGADRTEQARQAASYVDSILQGEKASNLPVQNPTKYGLFINLKTAKSLGLTVPPGVLSIADEVIE